MDCTYDSLNRLIQATNSNGTERYAYGSDNRRVYQKKADGSEFVFFYGVNGDRLGTLQLMPFDGFLFTKVNIYFAGRMTIWGQRTRSSRQTGFGAEYVALLSVWRRARIRDNSRKVLEPCNCNRFGLALP